MKRTPKTAAPKTATRDAAVPAPTGKADTELKEQDLDKVNGGLIALLIKQN